MVLTPWFLKARAKAVRSRRVEDGFLLSETRFRTEVTRERVRADRNRSSFALLAIELPADRSRRRDHLKLSRLLRRRLRVTDTAGYLANGRVAALLPDTPKAGAWKVASDICDAYPVGHERPSCEVFIYPEENPPTVDSNRQLHEQPLSSLSADFDSLFVQPTPMIKRAIDVVGASLGLLAASPLILVMAVLIKLTSPGPVFFAQLREGLGGRRFRMYKLRSMRADAHQHQSALRAFSVQDGPAFKMWHDPRTTWIGRWLRRTSLDELPQLWNVLVGDMSLVGPRPLPVAESLQCCAWQRRRLDVLPGLTCVWQVRGRNVVSFEDWMRMDLEYLRRRSLTFDVGLLLSTIPTLVLKRGPR
jgi:lipopolysaccharide/colanic/teichoic acid biosynthesis glycosyltransferase